MDNDYHKRGDLMHIQMAGLNEILNNLARLPFEDEEENAVANTGAKVVQKYIVAEVPSSSDKKKKIKLKKNIKIQRARNGEAKIHTGKAYHGHILEFGRSAGSTIVKKNGKTQTVTWGKINPNPFFTRGSNASESEAKQAMANEIRKLKNL